MLSDEQLRHLYEDSRIIAVVGLSENPERPSHQVAIYLKSQGYTIVPVNPNYTTVLGETCYPDLILAEQSVRPQKIDIVDVFRRSEFVPPHVDEAIKIGARVVWLQEGIEHREAAERARTHGLTVVMNRCLMKEHQRLTATT